MGNLGAYATERRENPDEGMGVGPEGSMWGIGKEAVRGEGGRRESAQREREYLLMREYAKYIKVRGVRGRLRLHATPLGNMR